MAIGGALGFSNLGTIVLAFLFGYTLTRIPLLRAGLALSGGDPDRSRLRHPEHCGDGGGRHCDHLIVPGAMEAGIGSVLFWGSLSFALAKAGAVALPVNRWLIDRGKGHAAVHRTGIHSGPPIRVVAVATVLAFVFGSAMLIGGDGGEDQQATPAMHDE